MRRLVPAVLALTVFLASFAVMPVAAQSDSGHVYVHTYYKALPGQGNAYTTFIREVSFPWFDELVKRGMYVSFRIVGQGAGAGEYSHVFIAEYENWDAVDDQLEEGVAEEVCQALWSMTCEEKFAENDTSTMRTFVRQEVYYSLRQ